jgi:5-methylcytosine-specific restriction endonuclease McrA
MATKHSDVPGGLSVQSIKSERIKAMLDQGMTVAEIVAETRFSQSYVYKQRPISRPTTRITPEEQGRYIEQYQSGDPISVIAERAGRSTQSVHAALRRAGVTMRKAAPPRRVTPKPSGTQATRLASAILHLWDDRQTIASIAHDLSCGENTVRRVLDANRPGERLSRLVVVPRTVCEGCGESYPAESFPERLDRPGKRHARCFACLRDWRRQWQKANPERNREGVRRRRARLRNARQIHYRDSDIFERDGGACWFCTLPVDPNLSFPDPKAMVIHHLHPIAKQGPDIPKNVALAHYDCNHKAKDAYDPPFARWVVSQIPITEARTLVKERHYLHRVGPISYAFGLYDNQDRIRGVITFGSPTSNRIVRSVTDAEVTVLELSRLWIEDQTPFGGGSWFLSRALRMLPAAIVISYADNDVQDPWGHSHDGGVYRACSLNYSGTSRPATEYRLPGSSRNVGKHTAGSEPHRVSPKSRYWTVTGTARQKRTLRAVMKWPVLPYLKIDRQGSGE